MEMDMMRRSEIPSFGNWDFYDDLPVTQYFNSAREAGLLRRHFFVEDVDLFQVPPSPLPYHYQKTRKVRKEGRKKDHLEFDYLREQRKQKRVCDETHEKQQQEMMKRTPKAVDEDLYKIPPELLCQKPKRRVVVSNFWKGCLGLNCMA